MPSSEIISKINTYKQKYLKNIEILLTLPQGFEFYQEDPEMLIVRLIQVIQL